MAGVDLLGHQPTPTRGRGRPKGAKNKRTSDLREYIAAKFAGRTPGQQLAAMVLVTDGEVKAAGSQHLALAVKAREVADILHCKPAEAFKMLLDGQRDLMAYIHPKLAQLDVTSNGQQLAAPMVVIGDAPGLALGGLAGGDLDLIDLDHSDYGNAEENQPLSLPTPGQVTGSKSQD